MKGNHLYYTRGPVEHFQHAGVEFAPETLLPHGFEWFAVISFRDGERVGEFHFGLRNRADLDTLLEHWNKEAEAIGWSYHPKEDDK